MAGMQTLIRTAFDEWRGQVCFDGLASSVGRLKRRVAELEKMLEEADENKRVCVQALKKVFANSEREQKGRAACGRGGCEACAQNEGVARRCMSPGFDGLPCDVTQFLDEVHAIEVDEHGIKLCQTCRGKDMSRHTPTWRGEQEPLPCTALGSPPRIERPFATHHAFLPIASADAKRRR
jgi:hypothetical protein